MKGIKVERAALFHTPRMPDYYPLLVGALAALDSNTEKTRRLVYAMARDALIK
jgi:hypothetical protein